MYARSCRALSVGTGSCLLFLCVLGHAQVADSPLSAMRAHDPGPRPNPPTMLPNAVPGLNRNEMMLFSESLLRVSELEGTCDTCSQQPPNVPPIDPDPN